MHVHVYHYPSASEMPWCHISRVLVFKIHVDFMSPTNARNSPVLRHVYALVIKPLAVALQHMGKLL